MSQLNKSLATAFGGSATGDLKYRKPAARSISLRLASAMVGRANPYRDSDGRFGSGPGGGNGLNHKQVYDLQAGESDTQVRKVYEAEEKVNPQVTNKSEPPRGPSGEMLKKGEITQAQYDKEYKEYSKAHATWAKESSRSIQSDLGAKHLNGTPKGTQAYVDEVTTADWFVAEFGDGGPIGTPKVAHKASNRFAGRYYVSTKDGGVSGLDMQKSMVLHEPTLIHELSHYATTISETKPFAGHGASFTKNHILIASKIAGADYAEKLQKAYEEGGVKIG